ncbi:hypothetical protein P879_01118 [Paragonimus westermani]|uniref:G8 domain-containing protein n=1 Tax=Paragonimus westermani TaxID=34504 RepID=A0A8T0DKK1_9TREM|nr:hypothetical protein P879_01118 [Paragonimus westermani]
MCLCISRLEKIPSGFAQSAFTLNLDDPNSGNHVYLENDWQTIKAELIEQGPNMIKFAAPSGPQGKYDIKIYINGQLVGPTQCRVGLCSLFLRDDVRPVFNATSPQYGPPVTEWDSTTSIPIMATSRAEEVEIKLVSSTSYQLIKPQLLGEENITMVVDSPFGKSEPEKQVYRVGRAERLFMFQSYATIQSVDPQTSGNRGGATIFVYGPGFQQEIPPEVFVGQYGCTVDTVDEDGLTCRLPLIENSAIRPYYPGKRGVLYKEYNNVVLTTEDSLQSLDFAQLTDKPSKEAVLFQPEVNMNLYYAPGAVLRIRGIFIPPKESDYLFEVVNSPVYRLFGGLLKDDQIENMMKEQLNGLDVTVTIKLHTADRLQFQITLPEDYGDAPNLEVRTVPPSSPVIAEVTKGMTPINNQIRPSLGGVPSMVTFPIAGTITEVALAYMNLRTTFCPSRLNTPDPTRVGYFENFETPTQSYRVDYVPAFCGRYSRVNPYWFDFGTPVNLNRFPYSPILNDTTSMNVQQSLRDDRWPNTAISLVMRKQRQLRPPSGTVRLSFKGVPTAPIPLMFLDGQYIQRVLQTHPYMGQPAVYRQGWCNDYTYQIQFVTIGGQQPLIQDFSDKSKFQVRLYVNNIPTNCNSSCGHLLTANSVPTISSASLQQVGTVGTLKVIGTGFDASNSKLNELILQQTSNSPAAVLAGSSTATQLLFYQMPINQIPAGTIPARVRVTRFGYSALSNIDFGTAGSSINTLTPNKGSLGGGLTVVITGARFYPPTARVLFKDVECPITFCNATSISCIAPSSTTAQTVSVIVKQNGIDITGLPTFTYDQRTTPTVTSMSPNTGIPLTGKTSITITGTGFTSVNQVQVGDTSVTDFVSKSDTEIKLLAPAQTAPGKKNLSVYAPNAGFSATMLPIIYVFELNSVSLQAGSWLGGQTLQLRGNGFIQNSSVWLDFQTTSATCIQPHPVSCSVTDLTSTTITCITEAMSTEYVTENSGIQNSEFSVLFTKPGFYYYCSGKDFPSIGVVEVLPFGDCVAEVVVKYDDIVANHLGAFNTNYMGNSACSGLSPCISLGVPTALTAKHTYAMRRCLTPQVDGFKPSRVAASDRMIFQTQGLASCHNDIVITLNGAECVHQTQTIANANTIECTITDANAIDSSLIAGQLLEAKLTHSTLGSALLTTFPNATDRSVYFLPEISPVNVVQHGSPLGGGQLTITGSGYDSDHIENNRVSLGSGYNCKVTNVQPGELECKLAEFAQGMIPVSQATEMSINVQVQDSTGQWIPAKCASTPNCVYVFDPAQTPQITNVEPQTVSAVQNITLKGSQLVQGSETVADLVITIGKMNCIAMSGNAQTVTCKLAGNLPFGDHAVTFSHVIRGKAMVSSNVRVTSIIRLNSVTPATGSFAGGTLVRLSGNGLDANGWGVLIGTAVCQPSRLPSTSSELTCYTPSSPATTNTATADVTVQVNGVTKNSLPNAFVYDRAVTPQITRITAEAVTWQGDRTHQLTIVGTRLLGDTSGQPQVKVDDQYDCLLNSTSAPTNTQLVCGTNQLVNGIHSVKVMAPVYGYAETDVTFTIDLTLDQINPNSGSLVGGQEVTLTGTGFAGNQTLVQICGRKCEQLTGSSLKLTCLTPNTGLSVDVSCEVVITIQKPTGAPTVLTIRNAYAHRVALTPTITSVGPLIGGTMGGTNLVLSGTGLGSQTDVRVDLGGTECTVQSNTGTNLTCVTNEHSPAGKVPVIVTVRSKGRASGQFQYFYVDRWSSSFTWGGNPPPEEDEMVVIPAQKTVLLDTDTAILTMLIIDGGVLMFDPTKDVVLSAKYILVINGGQLKIGSETEPYPARATIMLHGHVRDRELPLYGAKVLALRNGSIEIYGMPRPVVWTRLAQTAEPGSNVIRLTQPVDWKAGEKIIITSTGGKFSHGENEEHEIASVESNNKTVHLVGVIAYRKLSVKVNYTATVQGFFAAEVGLLTRNVLIQGTNEPTVPSDVPRCDAGFTTGHFATQTCVQGDPANQMGAEEYGGHVHIGGPELDSGVVKARLSFVELTYMGQSYRLGRYPIHFHLNGRMLNSFVKGCSIHNTFNRAINLHNTHEVLIENNVVYDVMGGAFFLEDGIEHGNIIQYNLFVHVKKTNSLLNDDVVPAAYWITNPNNTVRHNVAAGGTNFGFCCGSSTWNNAVFRGLFAWNNNKGPECVNCGGVQFQDMLLVNNDEAGIEGKLLRNGKLYDPLKGPLYKNVHVVGYEESLSTVAQTCHTRAVVLPWSSGLTVSGLTMRNFNGPNCTAIFGTVVTCLCSWLCGGYEYRFNNITWVNTDNRAEFRWHGDYSLRDEDGSLVSGIAGVTPRPGALIVGWANHLPADKCGAAIGNLGTAYSQGDVAGVLCLPEVTALRYTIADIVPMLLAGGKLRVKLLGGGTEDVPYRTRGLTDGAGWMTTLVNNHTYVVNFEGAPAFSNFSYTGHMDNFRDGDYIIIRHEGVPKKPDMVGVIQGVAPVEPFTSPLDPAVSSTGDVYYNASGKYLEYIIKVPTNRSSFVSYTLAFNSFNCFFPSCATPTTVQLTNDIPARPSNALFWSKDETWGTDLGPRPTNGSSLIIPRDKWLVLDTSINIRLEVFRIAGAFEIMSGTQQAQMDYRIAFKQLSIERGRFLAGITPETPLSYANLTLTVCGKSTDPDNLTSIGGTVIGPKAIAVYGQMFLHGQRRLPPWTRLYKTAEAGTKQLRLEEPMSTWQVGDRVVVSTTSKDFRQSEVRTIVSLSEDRTTVELDSNLQYTHVVYNDRYGTYSFTAGAEVAVLTSNIVIQGDDQSEQDKFGGRILVSVAEIDGIYTVGQLRLSAVLLRQMGQSRYLSSTDARLPVAFINCGDLDRRSYINYSMFENSFSHAIGIYGTDNVDVRYTVVYKSGGSGLIVEGNGVSLFHVAVIESGWSGSSTSGSNDGGLDLMIQSAINLRRATAAKLYDVVAGGGERVCIVTSGLNCDVDSLNQWQYVVAHSCLIGMMNVAENMNCTLVRNVIVYSTSDFSIYWHTMSSVQADSVQLVDNTGGLYPYISKPDAQLNEHHNKTFTLKNSLVVGRSGRQSCTDAAPVEVVKRAEDLLGPYAPGGGNLGITPAQFMSTNGIVEKTGLQDWGSEFSLGGASYLQNVTLANFGSSCPGAVDMVWRTAAINEDGVQPTYMEQITLQDVKLESKVYFDRPALRNVKFGKCGDMECDGLKKALLIDKDGTFLGAPGSSIPQSEWQWDLNPAYGIVSSQIPVRMRTNRDGSTRDVNTVWPKKGIIRDESCVYSEVMQGYKCGAALQHRLLIIESMDTDQLVRRVAPIGFGTEGLQVNYLDLINGPADHGVCSSYVCMKRMSAFFAVVAQSKQFVTYFTATPPQHLRLRLLQAPADYAVRVGFDYLSTARLDVYANGQYVKPSNGAYNDKNQLILSEPTSDDQFMPNVDTDAAGTNYYNENRQMLFVILKGTVIVEIKLAQVVKLAFGISAMSEAEFFASNVIENLALFLGIPSSRVRVVNVIRETPSVSATRQKRQTGSLNVVLEISEPPGNISQPLNTSTSNGSTAMEQVSANIINAIQSDQLSAALNAPVENVQVQQPTPLPSSATWSALTANGSVAVQQMQTVQTPSSVEGLLTPSTLVEGVTSLLRFHTKDDAGNHVQQLGSETDSWVYDININGESSVAGSKPFPTTHQGWAEENITLNTPGSYTIRITITNPSGTRNLTTTMTKPVIKREFTLNVKLIGIDGTNTNWNPNLNPIPQGARPKIEVKLLDKSTGTIAKNIGWRGFKWKLNVGPCGVQPIYSAEVSTEVADYFWQEKTFDTSGQYEYCFKMTPYQSDGTTAVVEYDVNEVPITLTVNNKLTLLQGSNAPQLSGRLIAGHYVITIAVLISKWILA